MASVRLIIQQNPLIAILPTLPAKKKRKSDDLAPDNTKSVKMPSKARSLPEDFTRAGVNSDSQDLRVNSFQQFLSRRIYSCPEIVPFYQ